MHLALQVLTCGACHRSARFRAFATGFGAPLTVVHLVPGTFFPARVANFGADPADLLGELRSATHERRRLPADRRAIPVEPNAFGHHLDVRFLQTSACAMFAFLSAGHALLNTRLMLLVCHGKSPNPKVRYRFKLQQLRRMHVACHGRYERRFVR